MNKQEVKAVMQYAVQNNLGDDFAIMSGDLADSIHARTTGPVYTDLRHAASLLKWQAFQFNGEWDQKALDETISWMRPVTITDLPEPEAAKTAMPAKTASRSEKKPRKLPAIGDPDFDSGRFGNLRI
jgi:hypothetical protein